MRKVLKNHAEVAHIWAQQTQSEGRSKDGNIFFKGKTIYSWGEHWPLATFYKDIVLANSKYYSQSTSNHSWHVRCAISHLKKIEVPHLCIPKRLGYPAHPVISKCPIKEKNKIHRINIDHYFAIIIRSAESNLRATYYSSIPGLNSAREDLIEYLKCVGGNNMLKNSEKAYIKADPLDLHLLDPSFENYREKHEKIEKRREKNLAAREAREIEKDKERELRLAEILRQDQLDLDNKIKRWRNDQLIGFLNAEGTFLRVKETKNKKWINTSKGVNIALDEAFRMVVKCRSNQESWQSNGNQHVIGKHYYLDRISPEGNLVAGCHSILWEEIELIAKQLEWI